MGFSLSSYTFGLYLYILFLASIYNRQCYDQAPVVDGYNDVIDIGSTSGQCENVHL